jgi:uracil-DNA glycosylase
VLGLKLPLAEAVASNRKAKWLGHAVDVVALPHPSGASPWHKMEPGKTLLGKALRRLRRHPAMRRAILSS